jgi:hypothetical protein
LFAGIDVRPSWRFAVRSSAKRGAKVFFWSGCRHAAAIATDATKAPVGAETWPVIEERWQAAIPHLLAERTKSWSESQRAELARFLKEKPYGFESPEHSASANHEQRT